MTIWISGCLSASNADKAGFPWVESHLFQLFCHFKEPEFFRQISFYHTIHFCRDKRATDQDTGFLTTLMMQIQYSYSCVPKRASRE